MARRGRSWRARTASCCRPSPWRSSSAGPSGHPGSSCPSSRRSSTRRSNDWRRGAPAGNRCWSRSAGSGPRHANAAVRTSAKCCGTSSAGQPATRMPTAFAGAVRETRTRLATLRRDDAILSLATAHATKGLEFDHVVVIGHGGGPLPERAVCPGRRRPGAGPGGGAPARLRGVDPCPADPDPRCTTRWSRRHSCSRRSARTSSGCRRPRSPPEPRVASRSCARSQRSARAVRREVILQVDAPLEWHPEWPVARRVGWPSAASFSLAPATRVSPHRRPGRGRREFLVRRIPLALACSIVGSNISAHRPADGRAAASRPPRYRACATRATDRHHPRGRSAGARRTTSLVALMIARATTPCDLAGVVVEEAWLASGSPAYAAYRIRTARYRSPSPVRLAGELPEQPIDRLQERLRDVGRHRVAHRILWPVGGPGAHRRRAEGARLVVPQPVRDRLEERHPAVIASARGPRPATGLRAAPRSARDRR